MKRSHLRTALVAGVILSLLALQLPRGGGEPGKVAGLTLKTVSPPGSPQSPPAGEQAAPDVFEQFRRMLGKRSRGASPGDVAALVAAGRERSLPAADVRPPSPEIEREPGGFGPRDYREPEGANEFQPW